MKVLQKRKKDRKFIGTCLKCQSIVEAMENELSVNTSFNRNETFVQGEAKCPECNSKMYFEPEGQKTTI